MFVAAALAMVSSGGILVGDLRLAPLLVTVLAVSSIYWFGDVMDRWYHLRKKGSAVAAGDPLLYRLQLLGLSLIGLVAVAFVLPRASVMALVAILGFGALDSIEIPFMRGLAPIGGGGMVRLKRVFFLKNVIVGAWWSLLLLIGAGRFDVPGLGVCALFAFLQITMGASIGNLPLVEEASARGSTGLTGKMGVDGLLRLLRAVNIVSGVLLLYAAWRDPASAKLYLSLVMVVMWRTFLFLNIERLDLRAEGLRLGNLATCFLFPLACALAVLLP